MASERILVVDDEAEVLDLLCGFLERAGYEVEAASDASGALSLVESNPFNVAFLDLNLPDYNGIELLKNIKQVEPSTINIMLTGCGSIETAVEAMSLGAFHYMTKPIKIKEVRSLLVKALKETGFKFDDQQDENGKKKRSTPVEIVGNSKAMQRVFQFIEKVADTDSTVLICGGSGTGKEMVARSMHLKSHRKNGPYVAVNCGAIPETLLGSELFGHEKGAFTGADAARTGRFELAEGGTIFLDEIGNMSSTMQIKLLRVLQERKFERVGGVKTIDCDVRVIAATNADLEEAVEKGRFREDLFYRLNVIPIELPPLREREGDIPLLVSHFLEKFNTLRKRRVQGFSLKALSLIEQYPWPGNVRELENFIERLVVLGEEGMIRLEDLPEKFQNGKRNCSFTVPDIPEEGLSLEEMLNNVEKELIIKALEKSNWVKQRAANLLSVNRSTLVEKIKKSGLQREE